MSGRFVDPPPAIINGYAARALAIWLAREWKRGGFAGLPPDGREEVRSAIVALEHAGTAWYRRRPSAGGSAETALPEMASSSNHDSDWVTVDEAAGMLGVSDRRVRQLASGGLGEKFGTTWMISRELLELEIERRAA